jgi:RHS repeat-associated protein
VGTSGNEWRFTGELQDSRVARGMYYLRARYYDPALGRFIGRDPFWGLEGNPQSQNRYPYVLNNPANLIDPTGLQCIGAFCFPPIGPVNWRGITGASDRGLETVKAVDRWLAKNVFGQAVSLLSRGDRRESKEGGFIIIENCRGLCSVFLNFPFGPDRSAMTFGQYVFVKGEIEPITERHEGVHVEQYERYGLFGFLFRYFVSETIANSLDCRLDPGCYYRENALEEEARERAAQE